MTSAPFPAGPRPVISRIRTWGGIGDVLLMTPALREIKRRHPAVRLSVSCARRSHFEVLLQNPHIDSLTLGDGRWASFWATQAHAARAWAHQEKMRLTGIPLLRGAYAAVVPRYGIWCPTLSGMHATEIIGALLNVSIQDRRLEVFFTHEEQERARATMALYPNPVAMHITSTCSSNQHWPIDRWDALVANNPQFTFIQFGLPNEPAVRGAIDWRGRTPLRESIARLAHATAFVGVVSSLAHATNATGTPAVVLFGPSAPEVWAHPNQRVLTKGLRCAPCIDTLQRQLCPYEAPCMKEITVEEVEDALKVQAARGAA